MRALSWILFLAVSAAVNAKTYSTIFGGPDENPISENGAWVRNSSVGSYWWQNVKVVNGVAHAADVGQTSDYQDPTVILSGTWGPDQSVGVKFRKSSTPAGDQYAECELRLRSKLSADQNEGYECLFSLNGYTNIVRWNHRNPGDPRLANFTILAGGGYNLANGDTLRATINGNTITMYQNGLQILQTTDNVYTSGSPGIGFDAADDGTHSRQSVYDQFGYDSYSATDGLGSTQTVTTIHSSGARLTGCSLSISPGRQLAVTFDPASFPSAELQVMNLAGEVVLECSDPVFAGSRGVMRLDLSRAAMGAYGVRLRSAGREMRREIVLTK